MLFKRVIKYELLEKRRLWTDGVYDPTLINLVRTSGLDDECKRVAKLGG